MTTMGTNLLADIWPTLTSEGALTAITYKSITQGTVTSTNILSTSLGGSTLSTGISVLLSDFRSHEIDGARVVSGDRKVRFPSSILSVTPTVDDEMVIGSDTYRVMNVGSPVDGASWMLQVRKP